MGKVIDGVDRFQRRHRVIGVPLAVFYKFFDDQGNYLAAIVTYYAFIAIFPLLLLGSSILGFLLQGSPGLQETILNSALSQFPIIGDQLGRPEGLQGSFGAVVLGSIVALYGALGLGQASQNAMNIAWAVPRNSRPNPFLGRARSLLLLVTAGVAVLAVSVVSVAGSNAQVFGARIDAGLQWVITGVTTLLVAVVFAMLFRLAAARDHSFWRALPGAVVVALLWQGLQYIGSIYVTRVLNETSSMNAVFGLVLGLVGVIYIASLMAIFGVEVNVVLAKRLYPRALLTPFTDNVDLTDADRRAYAEYAKAQRHKGFESISITFDPRRGDGEETSEMPHLVALPDAEEGPEQRDPDGPEPTVRLYRGG
ncbi:MAG: YihY/virulence factor BrkB family protein [Nocardioidaceae bacterium]|nr:YihY/virulence factor BrkB family protein [Nocardioidaceae bacterium]